METSSMTNEAVNSIDSVVDVQEKKSGQPKPDQNQINKDLREIFKTFEKPKDKINIRMGIFVIVAIVAGIAGWIIFNWVSVVITITVLVFIVVISEKVSVKHNKLAVESIDQVMKLYSIDKNECLNTFMKSVKNTSSEFNDFVKAVWGDEAVEKAKSGSNNEGKPSNKTKFICSKCNRKVGAVYSSGTAMCYQCSTDWVIPNKTKCPKCNSKNVVNQSHVEASKTASLIGGMAAGALFAKCHYTYKCNDCGEKNWDIELTTVKEK